MYHNPFLNSKWKGLYPGCTFIIPRYGECRFYRYISKLNRVEVIEKDTGMLRKITPGEIPTEIHRP